MSNGMRPLKSSQSVLLRDSIGVTQILHQLQSMANRKYLSALDVFDIVSKTFYIAIKAEAVPIRILGHLLLFFLVDAHL